MGEKGQILDFWLKFRIKMGKIEIPDYRIYKVEGIAPLEKTQRMLAAHGLKDPLIRNEVWRYSPENWQPLGKVAFQSITRGFKYGFAAFVATMLITKAYEKVYPDKHGSHH